MTMREILNWLSEGENGRGVVLFCLFVVLPLIAMFIGFAKWAVRTAAHRAPCPQCGWPQKVLNKAPGVES